MKHTEREKAILWFNNRPLEEQFYLVIAWLDSKGLDTTSRHPNTLTGREIEEIYKNQT